VSLLALQRDFRRWLDAEAPDAEARIGRHAARGLAVYLNTYRGQLTACLAESYGTVKAWIGDAAFEAAAATHIEQRPPHSWTLDDYALGFPDTLDAMYRDDPEVGDLARLECALARIFVGKDAKPVVVAALADIDWEKATIGFVPTLTMMPVTTNAAAIWSRLAEGERPPAATILCRPAIVAIWRAGFSPTFRTIADAERDAITALAGGQSFGAFCARLVEDAGEEDGPALAGGMLNQWLSDGLIAYVGDGR